MPCPWSGVLDDEGDLGAVGMFRKPEVVRDRDEPAAGVSDERELVVVVDAAEPRPPSRVDAGQREEPEIEAVGREPPVEAEQLAASSAAGSAAGAGWSPNEGRRLALRGRDKPRRSLTSIEQSMPQ